MTWWMWLIASALLAMASAFFAMLGVSAGTAYGSNYHTLSRAQRMMARALYLGSLAAAIVCGLAGLALATWTAKLIFQ